MNNNGGVTKLLNIEVIGLTLNSSVKLILNYFKKKLNVTDMEKDSIIKKVETVEISITFQHIFKEFVSKMIGFLGS